MRKNLPLPLHYALVFLRPRVYLAYCGGDDGRIVRIRGQLGQFPALLGAGDGGHIGGRAFVDDIDVDAVGGAGAVRGEEVEPAVLGLYE